MSKSSFIFVTYMGESHVKNTRGKLFFGLVCKVVVQVQKEFHSFHLYESTT
jgi:hypothetical protein